MIILNEKVNTIINPFNIWYIDTWVYIRPVFAKTVPITSSNAGTIMIFGLKLY